MTTNVVARSNQSVRKLDRTVLAIVLILFILAILVPPQMSESIRFILKSLWKVSPFLLLSIAIAAYSQASGADNLIAKAFQGRIALMIPAAALIGALSPFCSCGVIPLIDALLSMGVPVAGVMAFWLSAKTIATIGIGILGGFGTLLLMNAGIATEAFMSPLKEGVGNGGCAGSKVRRPKAVVWHFWPDPERRQKFWNGARKNAGFLAKWLALAFLLESLMVAYAPNGWIGAIAGDDNLLSIIVAALVGIPAYLNGYAALPLVSELIQQGMNPGTGMAFLLAGGATSIPAMIAVFALTRRPVFLAYLGFAFLGSVIAGFAFSFVV